MATFDESDLRVVYGEHVPTSITQAVNHVKNILADRLGFIERVKFHANFSVDDDTARPRPAARDQGCARGCFEGSSAQA